MSDLLSYLLEEDRTPEQLRHIKVLMQLPMRKRFIAMHKCLTNIISLADALELWDNEDAIDDMYNHLFIHMDSIGEIDEDFDREMSEKLKNNIANLAEKMSTSVDDIYSLLNLKK